MTTDDGADAGAERWFFAVMPELAEARALAGAVREALPDGYGRVVPTRRLHLTLVFLGGLAAEARSAAERAAGTVVGECFEVVLGRLGHFPGARVAWSAPMVPVPALEALAERLADALRAHGLTPDRRPFVPHVTVARAARRVPPRLEHRPVRWRVRDFALVASRRESGALVYVPVVRWPLVVLA
ncbi:MAG: RNA 2',3'-cyclic phosphodiesterase [Ectothiorhodospiraceae bacterium]|nr:RNA 2',3'-cyclic phosphodiesterase [Chromatiales bacterium]MCP5153985.1 RNA 2',3'-cyclic phosphodiesterase [Ectothiorhodospiraceae bacterium]